MFHLRRRTIRKPAIGRMPEQPSAAKTRTLAPFLLEIGYGLYLKHIIVLNCLINKIVIVHLLVLPCSMETLTFQ